jgi:hypothetical protein
MPSQAAVGPAWNRSWRAGTRLLRAESAVRRAPLVARAALSPLAVGPMVGLYFTEKTRREHDNVVCIGGNGVKARQFRTVLWHGA